MNAPLLRRVVTYACTIIGVVVAVMLGLDLSSIGTTAQAANAGSSSSIFPDFAPELPAIAHPLQASPDDKARSANWHYKIQPGDSLSIISERFYKTTSCWPGIYQANMQVVRNPDSISTGITLTIPRHKTRTGCHAPPSSSRVHMPAAGHRVIHAPVRHRRVHAPATGRSTYHGGGTLSCSGLEALWVAAGGSRSAAFMAAEIAMAESGGNQYAHSPSNDYGYWQINGVHGSMATYDAIGNAKAAISISSNGTNWNPWTTYRTGAYSGRC